MQEVLYDQQDELAEIEAVTPKREAQRAGREALYKRLASDPTYQAEVRQQAEAAIEDRNF